MLMPLIIVIALLYAQLDFDRLALTPNVAHPEPVYEGTPTDYCKDQAVFDEGEVPFLSAW